jgi:hypothetical protein
MQTSRGSENDIPRDHRWDSNESGHVTFELVLPHTLNKIAQTVENMLIFKGFKAEKLSQIQSRGRPWTANGQSNK